MGQEKTCNIWMYSCRVKSGWNIRLEFRDFSVWACRALVEDFSSSVIIGTVSFQDLIGIQRLVEITVKSGG